MTGYALIVPMRIDVLPVTGGTRTAGPHADFSTLPFHDGRRDVNPGRPFLATAAGDAPFEEEASRLPVGVHLHWTLPEALTRGRHRPGRPTPATDRTVSGLDFPCVPNRWLVDTPDGWWIVESDHLHPEGSTAPAVTYLLPARERARLGGNAPYRRVGRRMRLSEWRSDPAAHDPARHLDGLTAAGWGHPGFHAYHPDCHSVFGFHLATTEDNAIPTASYPFRVVGWYADAGQDPVAALPPDTDLHTEFGWRVPDDAARPDRLICAGRWQAPTRTEGATDGAPLRVVLGATGSEALAAHLADVGHADAADQLPTEHRAGSRRWYEEAVEAVVLAARVDPERPDAVAALRDARHDKEFVAVPGGHRWTIRARGAGGAADAVAGPPSTPGQAPQAAVARLHRLDELQQLRDRLARRGDTLRERLYADWCAYLQCKYPPRGSRIDRPDVDELRRFLEVESLAALEANEIETAAVTRDLAAEAAYAVADLAGADITAQELTEADVRDWALLGTLGGRLGLVPRRIADRLADEAIHDSTGSGDGGGITIGTGDDAVTARSAALQALRSVAAEDRPPGKLDPARIADLLPPGLRGTGVDPASDALGRAADQLFPDDPRSADTWMSTAAGHLRAVRRAQRNRALLEHLLGRALTVSTKALHELDLRPGPRFWRPRDPVLLLSGPAVARSPRHPLRGGDVACGVGPLGPDVLTGLLAALDDRGGTVLGTTVAGVVADAHAGDPDDDWHPMLVDWKVALHDEVTLDPGEAREHRYRPDHLVRRYRLDGDEPDLRPGVDGDLDGPRRVSVVTGRSLLSPHPAGGLADALRRAPAPRTPSPFAERVRIASAAYLEDAALQAVSLAGLHEALLMRDPALPVGIDDPLGFDEARAFAARVAAAIGRHSTSLPRPSSPFMPLRSGRLQLVGLRVIDSFGRVRDGLLDGAVVTGTEATPASRVFTTTGTVDVFGLAPRLIPPARLQMRWLAAGTAGGGQDAHDHPSTGPICGWLVPNLADGVLDVHGGDGTPIGSVDVPGRWRPAPGVDRITPPEDLDDPGLRRLVLHLLHGGRDERDRLNDVLATGLDRIEPDGHAQHRALGLLMGRPLAVVRARIRLELLGHPPVDHGWAALRAALAGAGRSDAGLRDVLFPVRIGEHHRLDDGLLGFWIERGDTLTGTMLAPQGVTGDGDDGDGMIGLTADAPATTLTMLLDPRAAVHATTGVLPVKTLRIPPEQYGPALHGLGVTVRTGPVLTDPGTLRVATAPQPGYAWSWLERTATGWEHRPAPEQPRTAATLSGVQEIREGWLVLSPEGSG